MFNFSLKHLGLFLVPFLCTGCLRTPLYKPCSISELNGRFDAVAANKQVTIRVKQLNKGEIKSFFGQRGLWLVRNRRAAIIPLHLSFYNHSDRSLVITPEFISFDIEPYEVVSKRMQSSGSMWAFGTLLMGYPTGIILGLGGFFSIPIGAGVGSIAMINAGWVAMAAGFGLTVATPFLAMGNAVRSAEANKDLEIDLQKKMLQSDTIIRPYQHFETLVFVKRSNMRSSFTISTCLVDHEDELITVELDF